MRAQHSLWFVVLQAPAGKVTIEGHILERNESRATLLKWLSGMSASDAFPSYWDSKFALSQLRPAPRAGLGWGEQFEESGVSQLHLRGT